MRQAEIFCRALEYAAIKHRSQTRKDGITPYIYHPIAVAQLVRDAGYDLKYQVVAILHDTLEDTDATEEEIAAFGADVLRSVKLLTRPKGADEAEYVARILEDQMAAVVKNADKICNLWDACFIGAPGAVRADRARTFAARYIDKAEQYYRGRFSVALDRSIDIARDYLSQEIVQEVRRPCFSIEEMTI